MATSFPPFGMTGMPVDMLNVSNVPYPITFYVKPDGDVKVVFHSIENDEIVRLELDPEYNISVTDALKIQVLIALLSVYKDPEDSMVLQYVRLHSLERHFKMST